VSATSSRKRPDGQGWQLDPTPRGPALGLQQVLDALHVGAELRSAPSGPGDAGGVTATYDEAGAVEGEGIRPSPGLATEPSVARSPTRARPRWRPLYVLSCVTAVVLVGVTWYAGRWAAHEFKRSAAATVKVGQPAFAITVPVDWRDAAPPPWWNLPVAFSMRSEDARRGIAGGVTRVDPRTLLGSGLDLYARSASTPRFVWVNGSIGLEYAGIHTVGTTSPVRTILSFPLSGDAALVLGCWSSQRVGCKSLLETVRLVPKTLDPRPNAPFARRLTYVLQRLERGRESDLRLLRAARAPARQATASARLSAAYRRAASALVPGDTPPRIRVVVNRLHRQLVATSDAYGDLAHHFRRKDSTGVRKAEARVLRDVAGVPRALRALTTFGYEVRITKR
jgi:hypothetical protein